MKQNKQLLTIVAITIMLTVLPSCLSADEPSLAAKIRGARVFTSPIEWIGEAEPPVDESFALEEAIQAFAASGPDAGYVALEAFLSQYPKSQWMLSVRTHLAGRYRVMGRYSAALGHWEQIWLSSKGNSGPIARKISARALAGWLELLGSLGRKDQMENLMAEAEQLGFFDTQYAPALRASREGMAVMNSRPSAAFRCGSIALAHLMKSVDQEKLPWTAVRETPSPAGGFKLGELVNLAQRHQFEVVAVRRERSTEIPVPSVVHWKLDHYAAIVERKGDRYKVVDPTFGGYKWLDAQTVNGEASGNFLVIGTNVPSGWKRLTEVEAATIHGKGYTHAVDDNEDETGEDEEVDDPCNPPAANDGPEGGGDPCGMPGWRVSDPYMTLWISDVPLYYRSASGSWQKLRLSYKQRALPRNDTVGGFGDNWECNWIGFIEADTAISGGVLNYLAGGGMHQFQTDGTPDFWSGRRVQSFDTSSGGVISSPGAGGNRRANVGNSSGRGVGDAGAKGMGPYMGLGGNDNRYGKRMVFGTGITRYFRTNQVDRFLRNIFYNFDNVTVGATDYMRLTNRVDKDGKSCSILYTNTSFPKLITSVTDPYGRSAYFLYDDLGHLTNIVDMAGLSTSFQYHSDGSITNMITPYGTNSFVYYNVARPGETHGHWSRGLGVTEPTGTKQLSVYHDGPFGTGVTNYQHMYSYNWNRKQYSALSADGKANPMDGMSAADLDLAPRKEWMRTGVDPDVADLSGTLYKQWEPVDPQLGARTDFIEFTYPEQGTIGYNVIGPINRPNVVYSHSTGYLVEIPRNSWGRPTEVRYYRDGYGYVCFTNEFNADGRRLEKVWGPDGERVRGYGYDPVVTNLLTSVTNAANDVIRYTYDANGRLTNIASPSGLITSKILYDSGTYEGFLKTRIDEGFRTNSYTWFSGNLEWHTNELGLATKHTWDALNREISVLYPDGTTVSNVYDKLDMVATKDRLNQWTYFGYNRVQQMIARTNANGQVTQWDYCGCGSPNLITNWNGNTPVITAFNYNMAGRLTSVVYPDSYSMSYEYDLGGRLAKVIKPSGDWFDLAYDNYDQLTSVNMREASGTYVAYFQSRSYDKYGQLRSLTDRSGVTITNAYDIIGRLTNRATLDISGYVSNVVSYAYTSRGPTNFTDELGFKTWFVYDAAGRLLSQTNANTEVLQFTYDPADQMLTLEDGKNQTTTWKYDAYGRVTNKLDAVREIFRYKYDQNGQLTNRWTVEKGDTYYRYDPIGSLTNVDYPGTIMDIVLKYDLLNRLTNVTDLVGATKFTYTDGDQLLSEDGPWADDTVSYTHDTDRRRVGMSVTQPNASPWTQSYGYDEWQRLATITSPAGNFNYDYWAPTVGYVTKQVSALSLPGDSTERNYILNDRDILGRMTSTALYGYNIGLVNQHSYAMNEANQRTRQTFVDGNYTDYSYDDIGQLKTAQGWESGGSVSRLNEQFGYAYDKAWNLSQRTNNALVQTFGVNTLNELTNATRSGTLTVAGVASQPGANLSSVTVSGTGLTTGSATVYADGSWARSGATLADGANSYSATATDTYGRTASDTINMSLPSTITFTYDLNGNLTSDGRRFFEYDYENQLASVYVNSAWKSEFKYDSFGRRRVHKEYGWTTNSGSVSEFITGSTLGTLRNNHSGWVGFRLLVGSSPVTLTQLGRWIVSGNSGAHTVKIVQADGTDLSGGSVSITTSGAPAGQFKYGALASPVILAASTAYYVVSQESNGGDYWYHSDTKLSATTVGEITGYVWASVGTTTFYPTSDPNYSFGPVSFKYAGDWQLTNEVRYVYDGMLTVQERDTNNLAQVSYTRGNDLSGSLQGAGGIGGLLARTDNGQMIAGAPSAHTYYHCDGNGNITAMVDTNGFLVARYQYDPYGNLLGMSGPLAEANTYRFSSKEWCANAGLYYYGFRYYEPNLQSWLNQDPIGEYGGINLYEFANSSPMNWVDAWGQCWNPFDPEFWAELFGGDKKPAPLNPNSNRALLNEEGLTPGTFTDENGNEISGGKCTALVCGAVAAGALTAMTDGLGTGGKAEQLGADAMKARKAAKAAEKAAEDAAKKFKKLSPGEIKKLEKAGHDIHELKGKKGASLRDLFKDEKGNVCVKPKDGSGPGEPTGININNP